MAEKAKVHLIETLTTPKSQCRTAPTVTVVVVNWNNKDLLGECLLSLQRQTWQDKAVVVVDNGSSDGSADFIRERFPEVRLIRLVENVGFAKANNLAMRNCQSQYVALLNNDAIAQPDWLEHLVAALTDEPRVGMAASKMVYRQHPDIIDRAGDGYSIAGAGILRGRGSGAEHHSRACDIFGACAGAALYRREMLNYTGWFDEDFFLIYEDVDLSFRAQLAGYRCRYEPRAVVRHKASHTIGRDSDTSVFYGHRNLEWVYFKNTPTPVMAYTILPHLFYNLLACVYFCRIGKGGVFLKAKLDAVRGLRRVLIKRSVVQRKRRVRPARIFRTLSMENPLQRLVARRRG